MAYTPGTNVGSTFHSAAYTAGANTTTAPGNFPIDYADLNYATGNEVILPYLSDFVVSAARARGTPLKKLTNVSDTLSAKGDVARVIITTNGAGSSILTDGASRVLDDTTPQTFDVQLNTDRIVSYAETDVAGLLSGRAIDKSLLAGRVASILNDMEQDVLAGVAASLTANTPVGTTGTALTEATWGNASTSIYDNLPPKGLFHGFLTPYAIQQLTAIANYNASYVRGFIVGEMAPAFSEIYGEGEGKPWYNIVPHLCQEVPNTTVSGYTSSSTNIVIHPESTQIAMRPLNSDSFFGSTGYLSTTFADEESGFAGSLIVAKNFLTFATEISVRSLYGWGCAKPAWGVIMYSN